MSTHMHVGSAQHGLGLGMTREGASPPHCHHSARLGGSEVSKLNLAFQVVVRLLTFIEEKDRTC